MIRYQRGFSYLVALFMVAILSVVSLRALENTRTNEQRDREAELLQVGQSYREAIRMYYDNTPGAAKQYPPDMQSLLLDERGNITRRYLRKLYRDPITASQDWGIISSESGGVMGVYSLSTQKPIKIDGFPTELMSFTGAKRYQDWQFVYQPL